MNNVGVPKWLIGLSLLPWFLGSPSLIEQPSFAHTITGRSLHSQFEHHVRDKFATLILYGKDNFKFYDIFSTYT